MTRPEDLADDDRIPLVPFVPFRCYYCGAAKPFTFGVRGGKRWHRCKECGRIYRSLECAAEDIPRIFGTPGKHPPS